MPSLRGYPVPVKLHVKIFHEHDHFVFDRAEVMVFELLALSGGRAKQGPAGDPQIGPRIV